MGVGHSSVRQPVTKWNTLMWDPLYSFLRHEKRPTMPGQSGLEKEDNQMESSITSAWTIDCTLRQGLFGSPLQESELFARFLIRIGFLGQVQVLNLGRYSDTIYIASRLKR